MTRACIILAIIVISASSLADENVKLNEFIADAEKDSEQWSRAILAGDLESITKQLPENDFKTIHRGKIHNTTRENGISSFEKQFANGTYIKFELIEEPIHGISDDGKIGWRAEILEAHYLTNSGDDTIKNTVSGFTVVKKVGEEWNPIISCQESFPIEEPPKPVVVDKALLREYTGSYHSSYTGNDYVVTTEKNQLIFENPKKKKTTYSPLSEAVFISDVGNQKLVFMRDNSGSISHYLYIYKNDVRKIEKVN